MSTETQTYRGYQAVIGIEVHVQLRTESKIFSNDSTSFDAADNEMAHGTGDHNPRSP